MRKLGLVLAVIAIAAGTITLVRAQSAKAPAQGTLWAASDLKWIDNPSIKGAQQAVLWGDPAKGAYGALKKVSAGTVLPMHTHTNTTRFVVVAGTISFNFAGSPAKEMGPQSYGSIPGHIPHTATCRAGADCVYVETSTGAYDMKTDAK